MNIKYDNKMTLKENLIYFMNCLNVQRNDMKWGKVEDIKNDVTEMEANMVEAVVDEYNALIGEE